MIVIWSYFGPTDEEIISSLFKPKKVIFVSKIQNKVCQYNDNESTAKNSSAISYISWRSQS